MVALSAAIAGTALVGGILAGNAIEAPSQPGPAVTVPARTTTPPATETTEQSAPLGGGLAMPLNAN